MVISPNPNISTDALKQRVLIGLPFYKSTNPVTTYCLMNLMDKRRTGVILRHGDAMIIHSRNAIVEEFLKSDFDWLLQVDDDMTLPFGNPAAYRAYLGFDIPEPFASFNTITRLLSHGKSLVGGLYFGRAENGTGAPMFAEGCNDPKEAEFARKAPHDVCKPTAWVATGCLLAHRKVFLDIEKTFPNLARQPDGTKGNWFTSSEHTLARDVKKTVDLLSSGPMTGEKAFKAYEMLTRAEADARNISGLGVGEDVIFSRRAAQSGHQPHVDLGLCLGHYGGRIWNGKNTRAK